MKQNVKLEMAKLVEQGVEEIIVREGAAQVIHDPKIVILEGNINAPEEFINKRKEDYAKNDVHVIMDKDAGTILLILNEDDKFGSSVFGKLLLNTELDSMNINDDESKLDLKALIKLLKFKKHLFEDNAAHTALISKLANFTSKLTAEFNTANDNKGNKNELKKSNLNLDVEFDFILNCELYKGFPKQKFKVEICVDAVNIHDIDFWFESTALQQLLITEKEFIFENKKSHFKDYVIIEK